MSARETPVKEVHVAVAVIVRDGRVLIARRPDHVHQGGLLEFPGGKVEPGETVQAALVREIAEETGLHVPAGSLEPVIGIRHDYGDKRVFLDVWETSAAEGEARGCEGQPVEWLTPEQLRDEDFPAANLAGVGVAFYLLMDLQRALREQGFQPTQPITDLLDLVALGTVADVVSLDDANRVLVEQGLRRIRAGKGCPGIRALLQVAGRDPNRALAADMGFAVGPRLNAAGRLSDMTHGIACLLAETDAEALDMAQELDTVLEQCFGEV